LHGLIANDCEGQPVLLSFRYTEKAPIAPVAGRTTKVVGEIFLKDQGFPPIPKSSTNFRKSCKSLLDYVIRRFNLSSARLNKPQGLDLRWDTV
jgi:hypothetical protein